MLDAQDDAGIGATHLGKTHHVIDLHIGVGTHVAQHRQTAGAIGQRIGQTGTHRLLLAFGLIPKRRHIGGGGGGRPDSAMAGAKDISKLDDALAAVEQTVKSLIK